MKIFHRDIIAGGVPVKRDTDFFRNLTSCGSRNNRALYKDRKGFYFQWDGLHGEWEKFDRATGRHLGTLNEDGTKQVKKAVKSRRILI